GKALSALNADPTSAAGKFLTALWDEAEETAKDTKAAIEQRQQAIRLLGYAEFKRAKPGLTALLESRQPRDIQAAVVRALAGFSGPEVPTTLLAVCRTSTPDIRREVIEALVSRPEWVPSFLDAVEGRTISLSEVPLNRKALLVR